MEIIVLIVYLEMGHLALEEKLIAQLLFRIAKQPNQLYF